MQLVSSMINTQVVQEIAAGNEDVFNALYEATYKMVYLQAQKILHDQDAAETVTQDVFVTVYRNIGKLENPEALRSWIGGIAIRLALKQRRTLAQTSEFDMDSAQMMDLLDKSPQVATPETALCDAESGKIIAELVDQLPQAQRATVLLYYYDSCAIRQIADIMECSEGTVKSRLNYARKAMQQLIEQTEQRDNIRLHSFSPALLLLGLGAKEQTLQLSPGIWQSIAGKLGLGAAAGAGSVASTAAAGSSAVSSTANTAAGAGVKAAIGGGTKAAAGAKVAAVAGKAVTAKIAAGVTAGALLLGGAGGAVWHRQESKVQAQPPTSEPTSQVEQIEQPTTLEGRVAALTPEEQRELWRTVGYLRMLDENESWLRYARLLDMDADGTEELLVVGELDEKDSSIQNMYKVFWTGYIPVYSFKQMDNQTLAAHNFYPKGSGLYPALAICKDTETNTYAVEYNASDVCIYCFSTLDGYTILSHEWDRSSSGQIGYAYMMHHENGYDFTSNSMYMEGSPVPVTEYRSYLERMQEVDFIAGPSSFSKQASADETFDGLRFDAAYMEDAEHSTPEYAAQTLLARGEALGFTNDELSELAQQVTVEPDATGGLDTAYLSPSTSAELKKIFENFRSE